MSFSYLNRQAMLALVFIFMCGFSETRAGDTVMLGSENFMANYKYLVDGLRTALLTNPSGVNRNLESTADIFMADPAINLVALFGPEHGIRGAIYAGEKIKDDTDPATGLPVYSLYGSQRKPTPEILAEIDVIFVDIQDIGLRAYTYIYTMAKVMEAAAESGKKVIVLDRPNPIGGTVLEGNLVEPGLESFVGLYPIPYRPGMTIGELAQLFNSEYGINCDLQVIPLVGWKRSMYWKETGLPWVPPSPHVPHWETVLYMIATGIFGELGTVSEGVGYTSPFELVGAPWINGPELAHALNALNLEGIRFRPLFFKSFYAHFPGEISQGVQLHITDYENLRPYTVGLHIMQILVSLYPDNNLFDAPNRMSMFKKVIGSSKIHTELLSGVSVEKIQSGWQSELDAFRQLREKYLLYKD